MNALRLVLGFALTVIVLVASLAASIFGDAPGTLPPVPTASIIPTLLPTLAEKAQPVPTTTPLRVPSRSTTGAPVTLTTTGIISATNVQRATDSLPPLTPNSKLAAAAAAKAADILAKQYFEHVAPSGVTPAQLIASFGYEYVRTGENLAMGDFASDQAVVMAWMDSPGHRANIMSKAYRDLGVGVAKGTYQGKTVWVAVQEFGTPLSVCPTPNPTLSTTLDQEKARAEELKQQLEVHPTQTPEEVEAYNRLVDEYNETVRQVKALVEHINKLVKAYNACLSQF